MRRTLLENFGLKMTALLLAVFMWSYVNLAVNPRVTRDVVIPLRLQNAPASTHVMPVRPYCRLKVSGGRRDFIDAQSQEFVASLDLTAAVPGRRNRIAVTDNLPPTLQVIEREPAVEYVEPIPLATRRLPVRVALRGQVRPRYYYREVLALPDSVEVTGDRQYVSLMEPLTLEVRLDDRVDDIDEVRPILVRERESFPGFTCDTTAIRLRVSIAPLPTKEIPVECDLAGEPAEGFEILSRSAEPDRVTVQGAPEIIRHVKRVRTEPIDVSGLSTGRSVKARLRLERTEGVFLDRDEVQVLIGVTETATRKTLRGVPLNVVSPDAYEVRLERATVDLELAGPVNVLGRLVAKSVEVAVIAERIGRGIDLPLVLKRPARVDWSPRHLRGDVWLRSTAPVNLPGTEYGPARQPR